MVELTSYSGLALAPVSCVLIYPSIVGRQNTHTRTRRFRTHERRPASAGGQPAAPAVWFMAMTLTGDTSWFWKRPERLGRLSLPLAFHPGTPESSIRERPPGRLCESRPKNARSPRRLLRSAAVTTACSLRVGRRARVRGQTITSAALVSFSAAHAAGRMWRAEIDLLA